jgi:DNA-binding NtrC family response regulator
LSNEWIEAKHLRQVLGSTPLPVPLAFSAVKPQPGSSLHDIVDTMVAQLEKALIQHTLQECGGNKTQAARRLKIGYKTIYRKLKEHNLA